MLETFPALNSLLELRSWTVAAHKLFLVSLAMMDSVACFFIERYCRQRVNRSFQQEEQISGNAKIDVMLSRRKTDATAADLEEQLLREEAKKNLKMVCVFAGVAALMVSEAMLRAILKE